MEIKFKSDTSFRKQFFVPDSFAHPAKMNAQLLIWIVERYTQPGEVILDSMAGSGTMMLACTLGRNVVLVELEEKFCKMCESNWEQVRKRPQLGSTMGNCQILQGDARQIEGLVDKIVTSPPYEAGTSGWDRLAKDPTSARYGRKKHPSVGQGYDTVDSIITSPPYEGSISGESHTEEARAKEFDKLRQMGYKINPDSADNKVRAAVYSGSENNIGNLKSESYLEAMIQVYQQCHKVLRPQGLMILVTKNFIRNKQVVRLDTDTIKLCEQTGFSFLERHYRQLTSMSFWRRIYHQKYPGVEKIEYEDVLVFRKCQQ